MVYAPSVVNIPDIASKLVQPTNAATLVLNNGIGSATCAYLQRSVRTLQNCNNNKAADIAFVLSHRSIGESARQWQNSVAKLYLTGLLLSCHT